MEIVKACDAMPCNAEVLKFLQENRLKLSSKSSKDKGQAKAATGSFLLIFFKNRFHEKKVNIKLI